MANTPFGPTPTSSTTGADIEDAFSLIEANGGNGEWEEATSEDVPRWLFPRFPGAGTTGRCENASAKHPQGEHKKTKTCKEFSADTADMYLSRSGIGPYDTDVETLVGWMAAPRNVVGAILVIGDPGTGKTALIEGATTHALPDPEEGEDFPEPDLVTVLCTPDHTKDSLFLKFMGEGRGENGTPYALGPIPYAAKHGKKLYMDEVMLLVDGVKPVLYALADGRRFLPEGNVDGSALEIHPDFRLIMSSNPLVRGASLPEPLASRCASTTLTVETSADMLRDLAIDESVVAAWEALGTAGLWRPAIREMRLADYWLGVDPAQSVSAFLPEHCPESQREQVRNTVISFIGGTIRTDGRLVVK